MGGHTWGCCPHRSLDPAGRPTGRHGPIAGLSNPHRPSCSCPLFLGSQLSKKQPLKGSQGQLFNCLLSETEPQGGWAAQRPTGLACRGRASGCVSSGLGACSAPPRFPAGPTSPSRAPGTRGGMLTAQPGPPLLPPPLLPQGHSSPFLGGRKLTACLQEQLGLVPSAVRAPGRLDNPGCVLGNQGPKGAARLWPKSWGRGLCFLS